MAREAHDADGGLDAGPPSGEEEITKSIQLMMRFIADLSLRVETCRVALQSLGVSAEDFDAISAELKRRWTEASAGTLERIRTRRELEALERQIQAAGVRKQ